MFKTVVPNSLVDSLKEIHDDLLFHENTFNFMFVFLECEDKKCLPDLFETA